MNNNKPEVKRERKKYSSQFKDQTVERAEKDGVRQVAKDLGIPEAILYGWRTKIDFNGVPERIRTSDLPLRRGLRYPSVPPGLVRVSVLFLFENGNEAAGACHIKGTTNDLDGVSKSSNSHIIRLCS